MKRSEIILPGHYCSKASLDADSKEIVRILGRSSREGYWITDDKKELPEYVLLEDYVPLDTLAAKPKQKFGTDIFRDFQEVEISEETPIGEFQEEPLNQPQYQPKASVNSDILRDEICNVLQEVLHDILPNQIVSKPTASKPTVSKIPTKVSNSPSKTLSSETLSIINKASIVVLNDNYEKKYGDRPYKQHTIQLNLQLPINYDLEKLRQIIELFELDEREIARYIAQSINIDYDKITDNILQAMLDYNSNNVQRPKEAVTPKPVSNENQLDSGIKEIDDLLAKFYAQKPTELEKE